MAILNKRTVFCYFKSKLIFLVFIFTGLILRLLAISKRDLWFDELLTNNFSYQSISLKSRLFGLSGFSYYMYRIRIDPVSFLYSLIVYVYSFLFGNWESLRYPSVAFSFLSLIIFYKLSSFFLDRKERIYALAIMVFSPFQIWYAQEAREYSLQLFCSVTLIYFYCKALRKNKPFNWLSFAFAGAIALYSSYYFLFLLVGTGLFLLVKENRKLIIPWLLSIFAMAIAVFPSFQVFTKRLDYIRSNFWLPCPKLSSMPFSLGVLSLGYSSGFFGLILGVTLFFLLFAYGVHSYYKSSRNNATLSLLLFLFPVIAVFIISNTVLPVYLDRKFIIFSPFYYIILSKSLSGIKNQILRYSVIIGGLMLLFPSLLNFYGNNVMIARPDGKDFYQGVHYKKNYSGIMRFVLNNFEKNDIICTTDAQSCVITNGYFERYNESSLLRSYNFIFYPDSLDPYEMKYMMLDRPGTHALKKDKPLIRQAKDGRGNIVGSGELDKFDRIWVISSVWEIDDQISKNSRRVNDFLCAKYRKVFSMNREGIFVSLFEVDVNHKF